jgi:predicted deacylase
MLGVPFLPILIWGLPMAMKQTAISLPSMTRGSQRSITVFSFGKAGARPKVYMQAAIHADEMPGTMAMHHLIPLLQAADKKGQIQGEIVLVPTVNPITALQGKLPCPTG